MNLAHFSPATAHGGRQIPDFVREPHRLQLRALADLDQVGAVDAAAGRIAGVSLLTADREATGHGLWIDQRTLETFLAKLSGRRVKAYAAHGSWGGDGTLDEVGYWEAPRIEGKQLREDFQALAAWRKHQSAEFDTLFELAEKLPQEFGASLAFRFALAWIRKDGSELPTERKFRSLGYYDFEEYFDPPMPADALRDMPSVRCLEVFSADFVCTPAANDGLFRAAPLDGRGNGQEPPQTQPSSQNMIKDLNAKFGANPALLARACHFHAADDKATFAQIVALVEGEQQSAELAQLRGVNAQFTAITAELEKAGFKAAGDKSALDALLAAHASFKAKADAHDTDAAALKAAGFEPKDGKSATQLALAAHQKLTAELAALRTGGSPTVPTGSTGEPESSLSGTKTLAEFRALSPAERLKFSKGGGKIVDAARN